MNLFTSSQGIRKSKVPNVRTALKDETLFLHRYLQRYDSVILIFVKSYVFRWYRSDVLDFYDSLINEKAAVHPVLVVQNMSLDLGDRESLLDVDNQLFLQLGISYLPQYFLVDDANRIIGNSSNLDMSAFNKLIKNTYPKTQN